MKRAANEHAEGEGPEKKLWGGRFSKPASTVLQRFSESISYDKKLYQQDVAASQAHAEMLAAVGLLTAAEAAQIRTGLAKILDDIENDRFVFREDREDIHMNIEARLIEDIGEPAKKLHTARSRNDQVQTDVRLYTRAAIDKLVENIELLQRSLVKLAAANSDVVIPGYTHLQRAQPVLVPHHLLAFVEQLERDVGRLRDAQRRLNYSPLGSGAMAGTSLPIDRHHTARLLGFTAPLPNSMDAVADRDYIIEVLAALSIIAVHVSRLAEEWVLWTTEEFGFLKMDDSVSTGSSMMPQKKNPDPMELARGKSARVVGSLVTLLVLLKGLPLTYNRDLQEDKEPLFDAVETVNDVLVMTAQFADNVTFNRPAISDRLERGFLDATTLSDYLVTKGMPFRSSHHVVGALVAKCSERAIPALQQLPLAEMQAVSPLIQQDVFDWLGTANVVKRIRSYGSTGRDCVAQQLQAWKDRLKV